MACDLAMACRFVLAAEDAVFGDPSIRMGLASPNPLWSLRIGLKKTKELLLTGRYIDGTEARRIGLVNVAVPADKLEEETHIAAESFSRQGGIGGFDGLTAFWTGNWASLDFAGFPAAYRYLTSLYTLSALQRPGRSFIDRGGFDFYKIREEQGLKAAIEARDAPFREYFPLKTGPKGKGA
jgi:enoyl-CoA hydratase/carnithine racemase